MAVKVEYHIISGRVVETRQCWLTGRSPRKMRGHRKAGSSSLKKIARNEEETVRRLARLINCNFGKGDIFVTKKYNAKNLPISLDYAEEEFKKTIDKMRKIYKDETGENFKYIWVPSETDPKTGKKVRIHHHIVMNRIAYEKLAELIPDPDELEYTVLDNRGDHTALAIYMIGNGKTDEPNRKKWRSSRGLIKPEFTEPEVIDEIHEIPPLPGADVKENVLIVDEESGRAAAYMRCVLPQPPKVRKNTIVLPKQKRGGRKVDNQAANE